MQAIRKSNASMVFGEIQRLAIDFGLVEDIKQGKFICPITKERVSWETLGRMRIEGDEITLYSIHATQLNPRRMGNSVVELRNNRGQVA